MLAQHQFPTVAVLYQLLANCLTITITNTVNDESLVRFKFGKSTCKTGWWTKENHKVFHFTKPTLYYQPSLFGSGCRSPNTFQQLFKPTEYKFFIRL